ncbi:hypothetical protein PWT90_05925 [Aphanocladium album]|nr:hypothetical protein PWT90_05925 [Aphanocladium album]
MAYRLVPSMAAVLALSQIVAGVNMTFMDSCPRVEEEGIRNDFKDVDYFNTTSSTSFTMLNVTGVGNNWFLYLTVTDRTHQEHPSASYLHYWLAVPDTFLDSDMFNNTRVCMAESKPYNGTLENRNGNDTCKGVVPDDCLNGYAEEVSRLDFGQNSPPRLNDDLGNKCDIAISSFEETGSWEFSSDTTCFLKSFDGVLVPKGYGVLLLASKPYAEPDHKGSLKPYHEMITEVTPTFLTFIEDGRSSGQNRTKVLTNQAICAIPNDVQHDSKGPDDSKKPADSAGEMLQPSFAALAVVIALCVALV